MGERFSINAEILIQLLERGSTDATQQAIRDINIQQTQNIVINKEATRQSQQYASSMRGLALDLRMMTIGLSVLRREFGGLSPALDSTIMGLYVFSAALSAGIGAMRLTDRLMAATTDKTSFLAKEFAHLTTALKTGSASGIAFAAVVGGIIGLQLGTWIGEQITPISRWKSEIKDLEVELRALQGDIRNLGVEMAALNVQSAQQQAQIAAVKREIKMTGDPTGMLVAQLKALESQAADTGVSLGFAREESARLGFEALQDTDSMEDYREAIDEVRKGAKEIWFGPPLPGPGGGRQVWPGAFAPGAQLGGEVRRRGVVGMEAGEVIMQREQVATMMAGGGPGQISISISLAGANISGVQDLEGTLRRGGEAAREEIRRLELQRRRGRSRY